MSAAELVELAASYGVRLRVAGDKVKVRPVSALPPDVLATLREHRDEIREHLRRQHRGEDSRVGPWQPPGAIRLPHRCLRCGGGLTNGDDGGGPCGACRAFFAIVEPARVQ